MRLPGDRGPSAPPDRLRLVPPAPGGGAQRTRVTDGAVVIEEKVSRAGSTSAWVVRGDGRRVSVQLPRGTDTPDGIAEVAQAVTDAPVRRKSHNR